MLGGPGVVEISKGALSPRSPPKKLGKEALGQQADQEVRHLGRFLTAFVQGIGQFDKTPDGLLGHRGHRFVWFQLIACLFIDFTLYATANFNFSPAQNRFSRRFLGFYVHTTEVV